MYHWGFAERRTMRTYLFSFLKRWRHILHINNHHRSSSAHECRMRAGRTHLLSEECSFRRSFHHSTRVNIEKCDKCEWLRVVWVLLACAVPCRVVCFMWHVLMRSLESRELFFFFTSRRIPSEFLMRHKMSEACDDDALKVSPASQPALLTFLRISRFLFAFLCKRAAPKPEITQTAVRVTRRSHKSRPQATLSTIMRSIP